MCYYKCCVTIVNFGLDMSKCTLKLNDEKQLNIQICHKVLPHRNKPPSETQIFQNFILNLKSSSLNVSLSIKGRTLHLLIDQVTLFCRKISVNFSPAPIFPQAWLSKFGNQQQKQINPIVHATVVTCSFIPCQFT